MPFDSFVFPVFFGTVLLAYGALRRSTRAQNALILVASYVFYGWWDWRFLSLIALSTLVDFTIARRIQALSEGEDAEEELRVRAKKRLVWTSVGVNLGVLALFKYAGFFVESASALLTSLGLEANAPMLRIVLPVGISFYTFQTLAYTIDVWRGRMRATDDLLAFGCYVAFFPQLVAGPIERAQRLLPQFERPRRVSAEQWRSGATLIVYGLVKKVAIADNMAPYVDWVFGAPSAPHLEASGPLVFAATCAFAVQIYADFSAYSDIARGTARWLGIELCVNFDQPYRSRTPSEFWRRWHISLSSWLRDYLYIPCGGNRGGSAQTYRNLMITMGLGGLWHGAAMNFVYWGIYHGAILCAYRALNIDKRVLPKGPAVGVPAALAMGVFTLYGWLLFRAGSGDQVLAFTRALGSGWSDAGHALPMLGVIGYFSVPILVHHALSHNLGGEKWRPRDTRLWAATLAFVIGWGVVHARASQTAFLYFQF